MSAVRISPPKVCSHYPRQGTQITDLQSPPPAHQDLPNSCPTPRYTNTNEPVQPLTPTSLSHPEPSHSNLGQIALKSSPAHTATTDRQVSEALTSKIPRESSPSHTDTLSISELTHALHTPTRTQASSPVTQTPQPTTNPETPPGCPQQVRSGQPPPAIF